MGKYICLNCGYILDLEKGLTGQRTAPNLNALKQSGCGWHKHPEERPQAVEVKPGASWADVPDSFACPSCGSSKGMFEDFD